MEQLEKTILVDLCFAFQKIQKSSDLNDEKESVGWTAYSVKASATTAQKVAPLKKFYVSLFGSSSGLIQPEVIERQVYVDASQVGPSTVLSDPFVRILDSVNPSAPLYLTGSAKIGKSSLCKQIALHWAQKKCKVVAVVYVPMCQKDWSIPPSREFVQNSKLRCTLFSWISEYWKCHGFVSSFDSIELLKALNRLQTKCVWILDGLHDPEAVKLDDIGKKNYLVWTGLPSRLIDQDFRKELTPGSEKTFSVFEAAGFSDRSQDLFANRLLDHNPDLCNDFKAWINRLNLESLCYSPGVLRLLVGGFQMFQHQRKFGLIPEPCLESSVDVLSWIVRCLSDGKVRANADLYMPKLIQLSTDWYNDHEFAVPEEDRSWLEACGLIGSNDMWCFDLIPTFFFAKFLSECSPSCADGCQCQRKWKDFRVIFDAKKEHGFLWKLVGELLLYGSNAMKYQSFRKLLAEEQN
jgi:hypothetical protein